MELGHNGGFGHALPGAPVSRASSPGGHPSHQRAWSGYSSPVEPGRARGMSPVSSEAAHPGPGARIAPGGG
eukprot:2822895-Prymnesium_polylepis.1